MIYASGPNTRIDLGDCRELLPGVGPVDAVVTDPPYGLSFMGKGWDRGVPGVEFWEHVLAAMKPGAFLVAFGGTRTFHRLTCAIEDAGFEIRDCLMWLYGTGFPKSLNVSKAIDKAAGVEPSGYVPNPAERSGNGPGATTSTGWAKPSRPPKPIPTSAAAREWDGWGTALKPAWEPIILARKPLIGTVAANVLEHGTGVLNIDGCRVGTDDVRSSSIRTPGAFRVSHRPNHDGEASVTVHGSASGRWPANLILDEEAGAALDEQSGESRSTHSDTPQPVKTSKGHKGGAFGAAAARRPDGHETTPDHTRGGFTDAGGASRFFYCAKASKVDRGEGNDHPTVKPAALMRYLCRLVTPPGGVVLDPFMGSGSTLLAAQAEGFQAVGIDTEEHYCEIAADRLNLTPIRDN